MTLSEKVAYLKGLAEGMELDAEASKEGKLISVIIGILEEMAVSVETLEEDLDEAYESIDAVSEDLSDLEEFFFGDEDEELADLEDYEELDEQDFSGGCGCGCGMMGDDEPFTQVIACPSCGSDITVEEKNLEDGFVDCPSCKERFGIDVDEDDDENNAE